MKKVMQVLTSCLCLLCVCFSATACWFWGGYNQIMYNHFSKEDNYYTWTVTVKDFIWTDADNDYTAYSMYEDSENFEHRELEKRKYMYISLAATILEYEKEWMGHIKETAFEIHYENAVELIENGFLDNVSIGDTITIRATCWTYSDRDWYFLAEIESEGVTYLDMQTGLKNITEYMDGRRSLL